MKGYQRYFLNKLMWFLVTLVFAFILNFILPRLMPGDPVAAIVARLAQGMTNSTGVQAIYQQYADLFGTNKPLLEQFFLYVKNVARGDFGFSFSQYPYACGSEQAVLDTPTANVICIEQWCTRARELTHFHPFKSAESVQPFDIVASLRAERATMSTARPD